MLTGGRPAPIAVAERQAVTQTSFQVRKDDFRQARFLDEPEPLAAAEGELLLRIERFALTANNLTYALYGEILGYWGFHPASDGWGQIPCWGVAAVVDSGCPEVAVGERLFGFWPIARYARLEPRRVEPHLVVEGAAHRQTLATPHMNAFYNHYRRLGAEPAESEGWQCIYRPLGLTGFMLSDFITAHAGFGANRVVLSSASSKTALATAHFLHARGQLELVGLTSPRHQGYTSTSGVYDRVLTYEQTEELDAIPTLYVDFAGDLDVTRRVHVRLAAVLRKSLLVGGTHWSATGPAQALPGPQPELYFVPDDIGGRRAEWGPDELEARWSEAWQSLAPVVTRGTALALAEGEAAVRAFHRILLDGIAAPEIGHVFRL